MKCTHMQCAPCDVGMCGAAATPQTGRSLPTDCRSKCSHSRSCGALSVLRGQSINRRSNRGTPPSLCPGSGRETLQPRSPENKSFKRTRFTQRHLVILQRWSTSHQTSTCSLLYFVTELEPDYSTHASQKPAAYIIHNAIQPLSDINLSDTCNCLWNHKRHSSYVKEITVFLFIM